MHHKDQKNGGVDKSSKEKHRLHIDQELLRHFFFLELPLVPNVFKGFVCHSEQIASRKGDKNYGD